MSKCLTCEYNGQEKGFCNWCVHGQRDFYKINQKTLKAQLCNRDEIVFAVGSGMGGYSEYSGEIEEINGLKYVTNKKDKISFPLDMCQWVRKREKTEC